MRFEPSVHDLMMLFWLRKAATLEKAGQSAIHL
jgi:hypothetical protein